MNSNSIKIATIALLVGGALGFGVNQYLSGANHDMSGTGGSAASSSNEPLYWVAPMD
ncbi:efflux transporter, RND family, MFP subunit, partial [Vibrio parahaemolyticus 861]